MNIAVSGAHGTGKTTLAEALGRALPGFNILPEPYHRLESEGHAFAAPPTTADFEVQLERSLADPADAGGPRILDRCPFDFVAYLRAVGATEDDLAPWFEVVREACARIDLVILVPVEIPDRVPAPDPDFAELRTRVDGELHDLVLEDAWGLRVPAMTVSGSVEERVALVLERLRAEGLVAAQ